MTTGGVNNNKKIDQAALQKLMASNGQVKQAETKKTVNSVWNAGQSNEASGVQHKQGLLSKIFGKFKTKKAEIPKGTSHDVSALTNRSGTIKDKTKVDSNGKVSNIELAKSTGPNGEQISSYKDSNGQVDAVKNPDGSGSVKINGKEGMTKNADGTYTLTDEKGKTQHYSADFKLISS